MRFAAVFAVLALLGCNEPLEQPVEDDAADAEHVHDPVYGGVLVEVGEHFAQVELVHDAEAGELTAYIWDGHVSDAVPLEMTGIAVEGTAGGKAFKLELRPVEDELTGDRAGHASCFAGKAMQLRGAERITGTLARLVIMDQTFERVAFEIGE